MKPTKKRKAEITNLADWRKATDRVSALLQLEPLNPTVLTSCVGWGEEALITYLGRRDWLQIHQEKLRQFVTHKPRTEIEVAVCRSVWRSYQFYVTILDSLIRHSNLFIKGETVKQPELFNLQQVSKETVRYVRH
jgi:hypothetical protein